MTPARVAHAIAMQTEIEARQALEEAVRTLRRAGADAEAVRLFLARCAASGRVLGVAGVLDDLASSKR